MEIRQLRSFVVLAEERHFGRAAARLHVAQPALSQQLKTLEREVGARLLDRSTRRVELTEAGRLLQARALEVLASVDRTTGDLALLAAGRAGRVRMGFVGTATYAVLPQVARQVREQLPDVDLEVRGELLGPDLLDLVAQGDLDIALLRPGPVVPDDLVVTELRREPLVAVLPADHPRAGSRRIAVGDLRGEVLVTHPSGRRSTMQPLVLDVCRAAGFEPEVVEVRETGTLVVLVAAGLGVGIVPSSVRALRLDGVAYVPLAGTDVRVPLAMAHRPDLGAAARRVAEIVRAACTTPA